MVTISLPDGSVREYDGAISAVASTTAMVNTTAVVTPRANLRPVMVSSTDATAVHAERAPAGQALREGD